MAEQRGGHGQQPHPHPHHGPMEGMKNMVKEKGPRASQVVAVVTLLPLGGTLLALSGMALTGSVVALALATPLFILFSPILVPAAILIALAVTGFLASGAFGLTALSSLSWIVNNLRGKRERPPLEQAKRRMAEAAGYFGQRTKELGQRVESKAQETAGKT